MEEVIPRFLAILGPDAVCQWEEHFCLTSHCPREKLGEWLATDWVQYHATEIARLRETAGPFPLLLIRGGPSEIYTLEIWCPKDVSDAPRLVFTVISR